MLSKIIKTLVITILLLFTISFSLSHGAFADTVKGTIEGGVGSVSGGADPTNAPQTIQDTFTSVINIMSLIGGALAVIFVIVGGLRYTTSGGNQETIKSAKNTIIYALIGLFVVGIAQVLVQFVLKKA